MDNEFMPVQIDDFYISNVNLIINRYKSGKTTQQEAYASLLTNRWWVHAMRALYYTLPDYQKRESRDELKFYDDEDRCLFIVTYRNRQIPFYAKNNEYYAILDKRHYCGKSMGDDCMVEILNQIDEQLDYEALQAATKEIKK